MLWGPIRPARARLKPAGFILPCQPYLAERPPSGPDWQHEIKWDGYRLIARKDGERVRLWARSGTDYTTCLDRVREAVAALPVTSAVLDGEAVAFGPDGRADFGALRSTDGQANAVMIAYDLLEIDGQDIRREPLQKRRARLAKLLSKPRGKAAQAVASGVVLSEAIEGKPEAIFREACRMGLEGIVSKRLGSPYSSGRSRHWQKIKNPNFVRVTRS
jgi:bifunctional non-homologous end joining protein LigD